MEPQTTLPVQPAIQPPIQSMPVPEQPKNKIPKKLVIASIVLLVVAIISVAFKLILKNKAVVQPTPSPTPTASQAPTGDLANPSRAESKDWKTYTNSLYTFQIKYPEKFNLTEDANKKDFYDDLVSLTHQNTSVNIKAIYGIDIYENSKPREVAEREVMDSGFKYSITDTTISGYAIAITTLETTPKFQTIVTIAHPNKNLFIQISSDIDGKEFDQILSTFRFLENGN
ncbi:MAG: hypothetical protein Q8P91_03745 [bacterium]|nr:hypothetical protein [bacterium]